MTSLLDLRDDDVRALGDGGIVVRDHVVGPPTVVRWAGAMDALEAQLTPAGMGRDGVQRPTLRGDRTTWLADAPDAGFDGLRPLLDQVRVELNEAVWLGLASFAVQLALYPGDGARYVAHVDALAGDASRRATAILYLNPGWTAADGGCLRVELPSGPRDVEPQGGRLVVFLSDRVRHEVLPTQAVRRAATAWYRGPSPL